MYIEKASNSDHLQDLHHLHQLPHSPFSPFSFNMYDQIEETNKHPWHLASKDFVVSRTDLAALKRSMGIGHMSNVEEETVHCQDSAVVSSTPNNAKDTKA